MRSWFLMTFILMTLSPLTFAAKAKRRPDSNANSLFLQGMVGTGLISDSDNTPDDVTDQDKKNSTTMTGVLGYRFNHFVIEFTYANLGTPEINVGDYYTEKHSASFMGAGAHWIWGWFDLKVGAGSVKDKTEFTKGSTPTTFTATPNNKTVSSAAGYFGIGLNFNITQNVELVFDYTAYAWSNDKGQKQTIDSDDYEYSDTTTSLVTLGVGLRFYL